VVRPGGVLMGSDSRPSTELHHFHEDDVYNPIEPGTLIARLQTLGFDRITVSAGDLTRFVAYKPKATRAGVARPIGAGSETEA
jgi:hypothetical protein